MSDRPYCVRHRSVIDRLFYRFVLLAAMALLVAIGFKICVALIQQDRLRTECSRSCDLVGDRFVDVTSFGCFCMDDADITYLFATEVDVD